MKKLLLTIAVFAMVVGFAPKMKVSAISTTDFTVEAVQQYIKDETFATAVVEQIKADSSFNLGSYASVEAALRAYNGEIVVTGTYKSGLPLITSIEGINYLEKAIINLSGQEIQDITPIGNTSLLTGAERAIVKISNSPVHYWPTALPDTPSQTYSIPTPIFSAGNANYLYGYGNTNKNQKVVYDVYQGASKASATIAAINDNTKATYYEVNGLTTVSGGKESPKNGDAGADFVFVAKGTGMGKARIQLNPFNYLSDVDEQTLRPGYQYTITSTTYYPIFRVVEQSYTTGIKFVKYSSEDMTKDGPKEGAKPVAGAIYELFHVTAEGEKSLGEYTTKATPIVIKLEPGEYYFVEKSPAQGFKINKNKIKFYVEDYQDSTLDIVIKNAADSLTITKDDATFKNVWNTDRKGTDSDPLALVTSDTERVTKDNFTSTAGACAGFAYAGQSNIEVSIKNKVPQGVQTNIVWTVNGKTVTDPAAEVKALLATQLDNTIIIRATESIVESEDNYFVVVAEDEPVTIWVENSTENDEGGTVNVKGCEEDPISSSKVYENVPREKNNVVEGQADTEHGWVVDVENIAVGLMGPDGNSGATTKLTEDIYDEETGLYIIENPDGSLIQVKLEYDQENEHVVVSIINMQDNIDIAIPFKYVQRVLPVTGDHRVFNMFALLSALACAGYVIRKRDEE